MWRFIDGPRNANIPGLKDLGSYLSTKFIHVDCDGIQGFKVLGIGVNRFFIDVQVSGGEVSKIGNLIRMRTDRKALRAGRSPLPEYSAWAGELR